MKKLIRDNIPEIMETAGKHCNCYQADAEEFNKYLLLKLEEECKELIEAAHSGNKENITKELADIQLVCVTIRNSYGIKASEFSNAAVLKNRVNGMFKKHLIGVFEEK